MSREPEDLPASGQAPLGEGRFAIARATFYPDLAERLTAGALKGFREEGIAEEAVEIFDVPGAFELPLAAKACASSGAYAGVACLGAVIRGETPHFDHVAGECARGLQDVALGTGIPVAFGVLTTEDMGQALSRAGGKHGNKGWDAAMAAMETADVLDRLPKHEDKA